MELLDKDNLSKFQTLTDVLEHKISIRFILFVFGIFCIFLAIVYFLVKQHRNMYTPNMDKPKEKDA
jgi:hypothetical protein